MQKHFDLSSNSLSVSGIANFFSSIWNGESAILNRICQITKVAAYYFCIVALALAQPTTFLLGFVVGVLISTNIESTMIHNIEKAWNNCRWYHLVGLGLVSFFAIPIFPYLIPFAVGTHCGYCIKKPETSEILKISQMPDVDETC